MADEVKPLRRAQEPVIVDGDVHLQPEVYATGKAYLAHVLALAQGGNTALRSDICVAAAALASSRPADTKTDSRTYLLADLLKELGGISSATLNKYVRLTGVRNSRCGERDRRFTSDERLEIMEAIACNASADIATKAREILVEIESSSKARK
jgi:hypothetical protein